MALENQLSRYGAISKITPLMAPNAKYFFVGAASLPSYADFLNEFSLDKDGGNRVFATVSSAVGDANVVAARGDFILVLPGHTETITSATTLALSKSGVTIMGLGTGSLRPTFTFTTAITANIPVTAANITVMNCIFVANFADITSCFTNNAAPEFAVLNCEFRDTDATHNFLTIVTTTVSVNADGLKFNGNRLSILGTTAATTPIKIAGTIDRVQINDNFITKAALDNTSCVLASGALVVTNLEMARNMVFSKNLDSATGGFLITTSSTTSTGMVHDNYVKGLDIAAAVLITGTGSKLGEFNNLYDGDVDNSGYVLPVIGTN